MAKTRIGFYFDAPPFSVVQMARHIVVLLVLNTAAWLAARALRSLHSVCQSSCHDYAPLILHFVLSTPASLWHYCAPFMIMHHISCPYSPPSTATPRPATCPCSRPPSSP